MRRCAVILLLACVFGLPARPAAAYSFQYAGIQRPVPLKWLGRTVPISLSSSLLEPSTNIKSGSDVIGAVRRSLARWAEAANVEFVETIVKEDSISPATSSGDGRSLITVALTAENLTPFAGASGEMPARTRVFFTRSGSITEADIALNPYQLFSTDGTVGTYDLESTITHELGHLLGLEHSSLIGATMQPRQGRNGLYGMPATSMRTLSDDDRTGIQALYRDRSELLRSTGNLSGTIGRVTGRKLFGANVWVEDAATGRTVAATVTRADGSYEFGSLFPGDYRVMVESLNGPIAADDLASLRGPYVRLGENPIKYRSGDLELVALIAGRQTDVSANLPMSASALNPYLIGFNGQLSTVPVPITPGRTYRIYLGGEGLDPTELAAGGVTVNSPYLTVNPSSVIAQQFGQNLSVISFDVNVAAGAPNGEYSIRIENAKGETAYLAAGLTIDGTINPWPIFTF